MSSKRVWCGSVMVAAGVAAFAPGWAEERIDEVEAIAAASASCEGLVATHVGTPGGDFIVGTAGNDVIVGLGGDDKLYGGGGADVICGNEGNDFVDGQAGDDKLVGGAGNDVLADQGGGIDTAIYTASPAGAIIRINNAGGTTSDGWGGTDSMDNVECVDGTGWDDTIYGDAGANRIRGFGGDDVVHGGSGKDTIEGGADDDTLNGNDGDDSITGDAGFDSANGGLGVDLCTAEATIACP